MIYETYTYRKHFFNEFIIIKLIELKGSKYIRFCKQVEKTVYSQRSLLMMSFFGHILHLKKIWEGIQDYKRCFRKRCVCLGLKCIKLYWIDSNVTCNFTEYYSPWVKDTDACKNNFLEHQLN